MGASRDPATQKSPGSIKTTKSLPTTPVRLPSHPLMSLQRAAGNHAVGTLLRSPSLQAKLKIGLPGDAFEQEADRVADQVMAMPQPQLQRQENEEEEEELLQPALNSRVQRQKASSEPLEASSDLASSISSLAGSGHPLPPASRSFFESRFGQDFSQVRIQHHQKADVLAEDLNARAFTVGQNIFFREDQYRPETSQGKHLLAHELTHVIQQSGADPASAVQRRCGGPQGQFDLAASTVGERITAGLSTITETIPSERPGGRPTTRPRTSPATVMTLLSISPCFLHDAQQVQWLYFGRPRRRGGTVPPQRNPPLTFDFHERPARGTRFSRQESEIRVHATTMADVVQSIVHEVTHASHASPGPRGRGGAVTRLEQGAVREEAQTRVRENEIMDQITASPLWQQQTGQAGFTRAQEGTTEVRASFRSGLPMLTYQEYFIIEQMLNTTRPAGINEALTREVVLELCGTMHSVTRANVNSFRIRATDIERYQRQGAASVPIAPPTFSAAVECARVFRAHPEWRRALRRTDQLPDAARRQLGPACSAFIEGYPQPTGYPLNQAYGGQWINEPGEESARQRFFVHLYSLMRSAHDTVIGVRATGRLVDSWFQSLPESSRNQGRQYLEWQLITETMSREWINLAQPTPEPRLRRQHLDFLQARIGGRLSGISRAGL